MKQFFLLVPLVAAVLAACARENPLPTPEPPGVREEREWVLTAAAQGSPDTRTVIRDGTQVFWQPGDAVKVFFDGADAKFTTTATEPCAVARFTGTLPILIGFDEGIPADSPLWGLYPWREDATADNLSVTTTLPAVQTALAGSFAPGTYITLGRSRTLSMGFWGVCGGLRFSLTQDGIRQVDFEGLDGETLAGRIRIDFADDVPAVREVSEGASVLTLKPAGGEAFTPGEWYYLVALPGTLEKGFRLTFHKGSRVAEYVSDRSVTLKRSIFGSLAEVDKDLSFIIPGVSDPDDPIPFRDEKIKAKLVAAFDANGDGEISFGEADDVTSFDGVFGNDRDFSSFDEFRFFASVTEIPDRMCRNWTQLTSIRLPGSLTRIGNHAFYGCAALQALAIPESVRQIGRYAFYNCSSVPEFILPPAVDTIGDWTFYGCESLREMVIPESVGYIGDAAFRRCPGLESVRLPATLTELRNSAFHGCSALQSIEIPESVATIGSSAFSGCTGLTELSLPEQLTGIGISAFENCTGLSQIVIPSAVSSIGGGAFRGCTGLESIRVLPATPPAGGDGMFANTNNCPIYVPAATASTYSEAPYWKDYLSRLRSNDGGVPFYTSTDYSRDGEVVLLQKATVGRGVNFILLGDGYVDKDMEPGGKYEQRMRSAMEALFAYEPYTSQRERFNVYTVKVVSSNAQYGFEQSNRRLTYESGGKIDFRSSVSLDYAAKVPRSGTGQPVKVAVLCNSSSSVGRSYCLRWTDGRACCILFDPNANVLVHELCGHGFGDLCDEYTEKSETFTDREGLDQEWNTRQWSANADWRNDPATVRWARFLADSRYASEDLGIFEGAKLYPRGIYRPSNNSMMRYNNCPFNAPSREQIYKNTMKWSEGSAWSYDYETFVAFDAAGREQAAGKLQAAPTLLQERDPERQHAESHIAPLLVDESVREVGFPVSGPAVPRLVRE